MFISVNTVTYHLILGLTIFLVGRGMDPSTNVVFLEDFAAVTGVAIAATCISITYYTGNTMADAVGSLMIGTLLGAVAGFIVKTNISALVGRYQLNFKEKQ